MLIERLKSAFDELGLIHIPQIYDHLSEEASKESISYLEFLDKLLWAEIEAKEQRAIKTNMKLAKLPYVKNIEEFDFQPSVDEKRIKELMTLTFVKRSENVILLGPPGVGKTHLAVGLAVHAIKNRHTAYFLSAHELIEMIKDNIRSGRINRKIKTLQKPDVLVIDEVGYQAMEAEVVHYFFQIVSERYEKGSIIFNGARCLAIMWWQQPYLIGFSITLQPSISKETAIESRKRKKLGSMISANLLNNRNGKKGIFQPMI